MQQLVYVLYMYNFSRNTVPQEVYAVMRSVTENSIATWTENKTSFKNRQYVRGLQNLL